MKKLLIVVALLVGVVFSIWGFSGIEKARCDSCEPTACSDDDACAGEECYCDVEINQCTSY